MARKNKIESSEHYEEIVERLALGESGRSVSRWLEETYGEQISFAAINRYKNNHINLRDKINAELNKREIKKDKTISQVVKDKADTIESIGKTKDVMVNLSADIIEILSQQSKEISSTMEKMKLEADDPDSRITWRDVGNLQMKMIQELLKHSNPEGNTVNINPISLSDMFPDDLLEEAIKDAFDEEL